MNVLCIDTSGPSAGVAVLKDGRLAFECELTHGMTHSQCIMPMVEQGLAGTGLRTNEVDLFAAVVGPGSFTGVRIGVSTVKALAHAVNKPCVGVDALEALAAGIWSFDGIVCPILDARAQQVYGAVFEAGVPPVRLMDDTAEKLAEFLPKVKALGRRALFLGDGAPVFEGAIREALGDQAAFAPAHLRGLRAGSAAVLASLRAQEADDFLHLMPLYLRAPQAERERAAREAQRHA